MIRRLFKEESGVALGLAVILIVIVGVMGAGLLVFVRNDLQAVVEVNQGQQAFDTADAGVQAAKRQLLSNACAESYDGASARMEDPDNPCEDEEESDWSYAQEVSGENDSASGGNSEAGKELDFDGKKVNVSIRHLKPTDDADQARSSCDTLGTPNNDPDECFAPELESESPTKREYFQVESTGASDNGDARRRVEAIFHTKDIGVPKAYYSQSDITISGNTCIRDVSVFSLKSINFNGSSGCDGDDGGKIEGKDIVYGNWQNKYNQTARDTDNAGFGAVESVDDKVDGRDYDGSTTPTSFVAEPSDTQTPEEITFPFEHKSQEGARDEARVDFFREEAIKQREENNDPSHLQAGDISDWPENSTDSTVVYVDANGASGGKVSWKVGGRCGDEPVEGTLIVDGAGLDVKGNDAFRGVTIVRGGEFNNTGSSCWDGFVNADEGMKLGGTPDPFVSREVVNRPGFYGVEQWSWRELYE